MPTVSPDALVNVPFRVANPVRDTLTPYVYVAGSAAPYTLVCPASTVMVIGFCVIVPLATSFAKL